MSHRSQLSTSRHSALFSQVAFHILRDFSPLGILWLGTKQPFFEKEMAQTCVQRFCSEKMWLWSVDFKCGHSKMFRSENSSISPSVHLHSSYLSIFVCYRFIWACKKHAKKYVILLHKLPRKCVLYAKNTPAWKKYSYELCYLYGYLKHQNLEP